jgi:hypothetical protein
MVGITSGRVTCTVNTFPKGLEWVLDCVLECAFVRVPCVSARVNTSESWASALWKAALNACSEMIRSRVLAMAGWSSEYTYNSRNKQTVTSNITNLNKTSESINDNTPSKYI